MTERFCENNLFPWKKTHRKYFTGSLMHVWDILDDLLKSFNSHISIAKTREKIKTNNKFCFQWIRENQVQRIVVNLGCSRSTAEDILANMKSATDIQILFITKFINLCLTKWMSNWQFLKRKAVKITGFKKTHKTQHCLILMHEMWKNTKETGYYVWAMLVD